MKVEKTVLANGLALATGILWIFDSAFVVLFPRLSLRLTKMWFHGMNIKPLGGFNVTLYDFVVGGLSLIVVAWVVGYVLGWSIEYVQKRG